MRVLQAASSFVTLGIAARSLTRDEFGLLAAMVSMMLILTMLDMGVGSALTNRLAASHGKDDPAELRLHVINGLVAMTAIGAVIAIAGAASTFAVPWHDWMGSGHVSPGALGNSLLMAFAISGLLFPASIGTAVLTATQRFTAAAASYAAGGLASAVVIAAVAPLRPPLEVFVLAILGCPLLVSIGFTVWVFSSLMRSPAMAERSAPEVGGLLRSSGWFALYTSAVTISLGSGPLIVDAVRGPAETAVFSVASRLLSPIVTVIMASGSLLRPSMIEAIARGDVSWARSRYRRGLCYNVVLSSALGATMILLGPRLAQLWVGPALVPSQSLFTWTAAATVATAATAQASVVVMAVERVREAALLAVVAALGSAVASVVLTRLVGVVGTPIGTLLGCTLVLLPGMALIARATFRSLEETETMEGVPDFETA
jgi:O-antigen/teichoic acid export membrane protein